MNVLYKVVVKDYPMEDEERMLTEYLEAGWMLCGVVAVSSLSMMRYYFVTLSDLP